MISTCVSKRSSVLLLILFLSVVTLVSISPEIAHAQSPTPGIKTDRAVYLEPPLPALPAAGGKFTDPVFGTQIMRATDAVDCPAPGCGTWYSQWPTFNADNSRIMIRKGVSGDMIIKSFDPVNFTLGPTLRTSPTLPGGVSLEWQGATWSRTDPDLIFVHVNYYSSDYSATGMKLYTYRPSTNVFALLKDFAPKLAPGQPDYLFEMHIAQDGKDDIFTFMQNRVGNPNNPLYFIVWNRLTDTVLYHLSNDATQTGGNHNYDLNSGAPDKSGRYIVFAHNQTEPNLARHEILDLETGIWDTMYWTGADDAASHGDVGNGTTSGFGNFSGGFNYRHLNNIHQFSILFDFKDANGVVDWTNDFHTTFYADDESWVTIGLYDQPTITLPETGAFEDEVMQIATDGSQRIRRLLHHRSVVDNLSETSGYWAIPKPTISRDGRFIAFTSNWENSGRYDLFIAKIDPPGSTPTPAQTPTPTPLPGPTPNPSPTPTATPSPAPSANNEVVWVDDALPANAIPTGDGEGWNWVSSSPAAYSGALASQSALAAGLHQHIFTGATATMTVNSGEVLVAYVHIDQSNPPSEIMLQWKTIDGSWEHRAYWGSNSINWGTNGTYSRKPMGTLPPAGRWIRLEVPASQVDLQGKTIYGMGFTLYGGRATWDWAGKASQISPTPTPTPSPTPTATPTPTPSPTPTPTPSPTPNPAPVSLGLVSSAATLASSLADSSGTTEAQIKPLVTNLGQAYAVFLSEFGRFGASSEIDRELRVSLYFTRGADALAGINGHAVGIQNRLQIVAYHLSRARDIMTSGASTESSLGAHAFAVGGTPVIGPADTLSSASFAPVLAPASLGTILGDPNQSPLAMQTTDATLSSAGELPYELNGVSVAIGGRAAPLISVSPSRISFSVPADLDIGETEVIVTLQEGYVSRGVTTIAPLVPGIFTVNGSGLGDAVVLNAATMISGSFKVTTAENLGADKQTRLLILASGISNGAPNTNTSNDVKLGSSVFANLAESVSVEARTSDGRVFQLPVEFAGLSGRSYGIDQVTVRLLSELEGAGNIELTIIVGGERSNMATVKIM